MADTPTVDVNTDDLDSFTELLNGTVAPVEDVAEVEVEEEVIADDSGATDEAEDESEPTGEDESEEDEEDILAPKKKSNARERINELTAEKYAEKRRADALELRLTALEAVKEKAPEPVVQKVGNDGPDPDATDDRGELVYPLGEFDPKYIAALQKHTFKVEWENHLRQQQQESEAVKAADTEKQLQQEWQTKLAKSEEGLEDLRPTIATLESEFGNLEPEFGSYLAQTIMSMDTGPEVLYYLANNLDEARKIVTAGTRGATLALGKIEARIESALSKKVTSPVQTRAPTPPITTRGNSGRLSVAADTDDLEKFESLLFKKDKK